jgi:hypothetical protein
MTGLSHPDSKAGKLQPTVLRMLRDRQHQPDGLPTSVRFLFYELVQAEVIPKHRVSQIAGTKGRRADQDLGEAVFHLRDVGLIPWEWISVETCSVTTWSTAASIRAYLRDRVDYARNDPWAGEPPPFILCESRSLAGVLRALTYQYAVPIAATNGQCGGFLRTGIAPHLTAGQRVLYLGDFDWQGAQIEANTRRVLEDLCGGLAWERLAITKAQVTAHDLPRIQNPDRRYNPPRWDDAIETEALGQSFIVALVRARLDALLPTPLADVQEREERERAVMRASLAREERRP